MAKRVVSKVWAISLALAGLGFMGGYIWGVDRWAAGAMPGVGAALNTLGSSSVLGANALTNETFLHPGDTFSGYTLEKGEFAVNVPLGEN